MKILTASILVCASLVTGATAHAQAAQPAQTGQPLQPLQVAPDAPRGSWSKNVDGFWVISYQRPAPVTSDQVRADLARAKANGQYAFGEQDYPTAMPSGPTMTRAQVDDELQRARKMGMMASDEEAYPPMTNMTSNMTSMH